MPDNCNTTSMVAELKEKMRKLHDNFIVLGQRFLELTENIQPLNGAYNVGISNILTGTSTETQGDITENSWKDFFEWLLADMEEAGIGNIEDLAIDYIEMASEESW